MTQDAQVQRFIRSREVPAVLKARLAQIKAAQPEAYVLAFEGVQDKIVYARWITRIKGNFSYEPFVCKGKGGVLNLRQAVTRDKGGLGKRLFFFVDRDFDDLLGQMSDATIFMTDAYSIENYLVHNEVLEDVLKNEFHCEGEFEVRASIIKLFEGVYSKFLEATKEANFRIFLAKSNGIAIVETIPDFGQFVKITLTDVISVAPPTLTYYRQPTLAEVDASKEAFKSLEPRTRYRGKFAFGFFQKWLAYLVEEYSDANSKIFGTLKRNERVLEHELHLGGLAARSSLPSGLTEFLSGIK